MAPAREAVQEIDGDSWLISDRLFIHRQSKPHDTQPSWPDGQGSFYVLSSATEPPPSSMPLPMTSPIQKVHSAADRTATWQFGEAFLKVKDMNEQETHNTREHVTLTYLHAKGGWTFDLPRVLHHALWSNRYVLLVTAVRGRTLGSEWPTMDEEMKEYYINRVIEVCRELSHWEADYIGGVDKRTLAESYMAGQDDSYTNDHLMMASKELGMDCSALFHFYHCDLGPGNIIVDVNDRSIGIIDWEIAGFVPWEWLRTKFRLSSGLDLPWEDESRLEYRRRVGVAMGEQRFPDVVDAYLARGATLNK
ncbi:hypothetical protein PG994_010189 [Apiospora phragmitis]|uniref:Aminoglycoside phosphotransferase domain-containing protein n=1 Tax=Apiospora phragmitis TaxID=2905665 RepID=A0ABR1TPC2_9PEZI